jgi:hypothetical protein
MSEKPKSRPSSSVVSEEFNEFFPYRKDAKRIFLINFGKPGGKLNQLFAEGAWSVFPKDWYEGDGFDIPDRRTDFVNTLTPVGCVDAGAHVVDVVRRP